jgi:hypothetical protein
LRLKLAASTALLALALVPCAAHADGDPASDVLVSQALYLPQDAGISGRQQAQLGALLGAAQRNGYQLRVALIASAADLGSVTNLWRQPETYSRFLSEELSFVYRGPVLVIMPTRFGLARLGRALGAQQSALAGIPAPRSGANLGSAALLAVQRLAAASGHPLPAPNATATPNPTAPAAIPWIVFAIGAALIALAWTASLRARPLIASTREQDHRS